MCTGRVHHNLVELPRTQTVYEHHTKGSSVRTVAGFVASSLVLIGRPRYFGGKIARIAALAFSHKLAAVSYNIRALGAPGCPESTRCLDHCPTGPALPGAIARYWGPTETG